MSAAVTPQLLGTPDLHLLRRFTFGVNEQVTADFRSQKTAKNWMNWQLLPTRLPDAGADAVASWFPRLNDSPATAWEKAKKADFNSWEYGLAFAQYTTAQRIISRRQVLEVMTDFWSNLLYIPVGEDRSFPWRMSYDKAIRANALGTYRGLLRATVVHPAMSGWLNNSVNTKAGINENLGRELLELYTVGRASRYSEDDVKNSARILTGFKVKVFDGYGASYSPQDHYVGRVKVLGFTHANTDPDGRAVVNTYLDYLARHPSTAQKIAQRLCVRFVSDTPSTSIVDAVAKAYRASDTDIKATLQALIAHRDFQASQNSKVRTPIEDVVNTIRVLELRPTGVSDNDSLLRHSIWMSQGLGQYLHSWPRPDGFPESSSTWASPARVLRGWDIHYSLAGGWWAPKQFATPTRANLLPTAWPRTLDHIVEHQSRMLLGCVSTPELRASVAAALNMSQSQKFASVREISDWTWTVIRGSVLNAPEGIVR